MAIAIQVPAPLAVGRAWVTVILLGLLYIVSFIDRLILALMIEPIKSELHVSDVQMGLLIGSAFAVFYTLASLPLARVADTGNRKWLIVAGAGTWGAMTVASAFAGSFTALLICRIGVGLGEAALVPAALSLIADLFPRERRALPTSIFVMIGACGAAGAMIIGAMVLKWVVSADLWMLSFLGQTAPWRLTLILVGFPAILLTAAVAAIVREPGRRQPALREAMTFQLIGGHLLENRVTYAGFFATATITSVINYSIFAWFPSHLIRVYGMPASSAGMLFGVIGVAATLAGGVAIPWLAVNVGRKGQADGNVRISMACAGLAAPLLSLSLLTPDLTLALLCLAPAILLQLGIAVLFVSTSPLLSPGRYRAQMAALMFLFVNLVGFGVGPPLVAMVAERYMAGPRSVGSALALVTLVLVPVQILLLLWSRKAFCRTWQQAAESEAASLPSPRQHAAVDEDFRA